MALFIYPFFFLLFKKLTTCQTNVDKVNKMFTDERTGVYKHALCLDCSGFSPKPNLSSFVKLGIKVEVLSHSSHVSCLSWHFLSNINLYGITQKKLLTNWKSLKDFLSYASGVCGGERHSYGLLYVIFHRLIFHTSRGKLWSGAKLICRLIRAHQRGLCEFRARSRAKEGHPALQHPQTPAHCVPLIELHFKKQNTGINRSFLALSAALYWNVLPLCSNE